jgi:hypothetical protein
MQSISDESGWIEEIFEPLTRLIPKELRERLFRLSREDSECRLTSEDLIELATVAGVELTRRGLHDLPTWGLLAQSTPEGRGPGAGVGRTWSASEAIVFSTVMSARTRGKTRRNELANIPVFAWLIQGDEHVSLTQVRRALTTWTRGLERLSERRARTDHYHHLLSRADVQLAIKRDPDERRKLAEELRDAPPLAERAKVAVFLGRPRGPLAEETPESEAKRYAKKYQDSLVALQLGIESLAAAPDAVMLEVRRRYAERFESKLEQMHGNERTPADEIRMFIGIEQATACPNTLTYLGALAQEADEFAQFEFSIAVDRVFIAVATSIAVREIRRQINEEIAASRQRIARRRKRRRLPTTS